MGEIQLVNIAVIHWYNICKYCLCISSHHLPTTQKSDIVIEQSSLSLYPGNTRKTCCTIFTDTNKSPWYVCDYTIVGWQNIVHSIELNKMFIYGGCACLLVAANGCSLLPGALSANFFIALVKCRFCALWMISLSGVTLLLHKEILCEVILSWLTILLETGLLSIEGVLGTSFWIGRFKMRWITIIDTFWYHFNMFAIAQRNSTGAIHPYFVLSMLQNFHNMSR